MKIKSQNQALSDYTFTAKYAKYIPDKFSRESWDECIDRSFAMHKEKYRESWDALEPYINQAFDAYRQKKVLGSQRTLQFAGPAIISKNSRGYNCCGSYCDRLRFFQEAMHNLLCGTGVGFSVQKHHIQKLPPLNHSSRTEVVDFIIEDSIEGWSDSVGILVNSYFKNSIYPEYEGKEIRFDYSRIRPKGASFSHGIGKAPGPEPLKRTHDKIRDLLNKLVKDGYTHIRPIDAYDIVMHSSDAVLSGGIRRCMPAGSLVYTNNGLKKIENIDPFYDKVATTNGFREVTKKVSQGIQDTIKVITENGELICTPNHQVAVATGTNQYEWKTAEQLLPGDYICGYAGVLPGKKYSKMPVYTPKSSKRGFTRSKKIKVPRDIDSEIAWLIGLIHADGYVQEGKGIFITLSGHEYDIAEKAMKAIRRFGIEPKLRARTDCNALSVDVSSKELADYFAENFKLPNMDIEIPECVLTASENVKLSYLSGVLDGDGAATHRPPALVYTIYNNFAKQLSDVALSSGVKTRKRIYVRRNLPRKSTYELTLIENSDRIKLNKNYFSTKKCKLSTVTSHNVGYPPELLPECEKYEKMKNRKRISTSNMGIIPKFNPVLVKSVEAHIPMETYDLTVPKYHEFFCQGYLVHNSATICIFSSDDEEMINAKTGNWFIDNPQRGRSNNSALLLKNSTTRDEFANIMRKTKEFGEPGFYWSDSTEMISNPCLTRNSWIFTTEGPRQVHDLIGKKFTAYVNGIQYESTDKGFFCTGKKSVFKLKTYEGYEISCTENHKFLTSTGWKEAKDITKQDRIVIHCHKNISWNSSNSQHYDVEYDSSDENISYIRNIFSAVGRIDKGYDYISRIKFNLENYNLKKIQRILLRFGIFSYTLDGRTLSISDDMISVYLDRIGFDDYKIVTELTQTLNNTNSSSSKYFATIASLTYEGEEQVFDCTIPEIHAFDANGFYAHNCVEISFWCYDEFGNSGWQFCNLSTINGAKVKNLEDFLTAAENAAIIGTIQAGFTDFKYLGEVTERIVRREALLGVSITGMMEKPEILFNPENQKKAAKRVVETNEIISKIIGINPCARATCVKPEGSASAMLGTCSGVHPYHSKRFIRRVQANKIEPPALLYQTKNPLAVEESVWSNNKTDVCIAFACEAPLNSKVKEDFGAVDHLKLVLSTQQNWVMEGTVSDRCTQPWLNHNVSNTINVKENEWSDVEEFIFANRKYFTGISLLGSSGDKDYSQAPFCEVFTPEEIVKIYGEGSLFTSGLIEHAFLAYGDLWAACSSVLSGGNDLSEKSPNEHKEQKRMEKLLWIEKIKKFSAKYMDGDIKKTTYLLKDVHNWKYWYDLMSTHKKVDYSQLVEVSNETLGSNEVACAGGACAI